MNDDTIEYENILSSYDYVRYITNKAIDHINRYRSQNIIIF